MKRVAAHYGHKTKLIVETLTLKEKTAEKDIQVCGSIYLTLYGRGKIPQVGDMIAFNSSIRSIRNFQNPGAFDYALFLRFKGIWGNAYSNTKRVRISPFKGSHPWVWVQREISSVRKAFLNFVLSQPYVSDYKMIILSLVTGQKQMVSYEVKDLFSKSGVSHLLAISGLHLSLVAVWFFSLFYLVLGFFPKWLISGDAKKAAGILTLVPLTAYAVFTGFSPSTQRALVMAAVLMISVFSEKEADILSGICFAAIIILLMDSAAIFSISFQLSFSAVCCIVMGMHVLGRYKKMSTDTVKGKIFILIWVTFFAGLGTFGFAAHYFHVISHIQIFANFAAVPLTGVIILPSGFLSLLFFAWAPWAADICLGTGCMVVHVLVKYLTILTSFGFSWSVVPDLSWEKVLFVYAGIFILFFIFLKRYKGAVILSCCLAAGLFYLFAEQLHETPVEDRVEICVLDVGQGSSSVIKTPEKKVILVDGGGFSDRSSFDTGRFILAPFLWKHHIKSIDCVILSHPESDHLNGLLYVFKHFKVNMLIKNRDKRDSGIYKELMELCRIKKIPIVFPDQIAAGLDMEGVSLCFLPQFENPQGENLNNNSLVFRLKYQEFSILFAGDVLKKREQFLASLNDNCLKSRILISPHHGSASSSSKVFLEKIAPESVIISCGWHNRYGFPHSSVVKRYKDYGMNIFRTDTQGMIRISSNGIVHHIQTWKGG